jgi:hypothetical protein
VYTQCSVVPPFVSSIVSEPLNDEPPFVVVAVPSVVIVVPPTDSTQWVCAVQPPFENVSVQPAPASGFDAPPSSVVVTSTSFGQLALFAGSGA